MAKIVIYGNQSSARELLLCVRTFLDHEIVGFTVDADYRRSDTFCGLPLVPFETVEAVFPPAECRMFVAVGYVQNNRIRQDRCARAREKGYELPTLISPRAVVSPEASMGDNCFIDHFVMISPDVKIGNGVIIRSGSMIGHDVTIADYCFLSPGVSIAGNVTIGTRTYLSISSVVRSKVTIGEECVIGAGAVLLEDAKDRSVYLAEPASLLPIPSNELPLT